MTQGSTRRGIPVAAFRPHRSVLRAGVVVACVAAALAAAGCTPSQVIRGTAAEPSSGMAIIGAHEEESMQITEFEVPGPAEAPVAGTVTAPNRIGSAVVPVRRYEPAAAPWAALVWAHGGSFQRGTLDWPEADWVAQRFAEHGIRVYSVDYVLAGDTVKAPAPANDVAAVLAWALAAEELPVVIGGASAGGHLAVAAALTQADRAGAAHGEPAEPAAALILQYPTLHRVQRADAAIAAATSAIPTERQFSPERIAEMYAFYLGVGDEVPPVVGELPAARLAALPPTVIVNADADDLRASGEEFAEQLAAAGVAARVSTQAGTVHGYLNRPDETPAAAAETIERFVAGMRAALGT